jgi:DNA/RNA-binding domain of Phe-tRNA-synthetase-like protein
VTAGRDLDAVRPPLVLDCSTAGERFTGIGGQELVLQAGDVLMRDSDGIISAVLVTTSRSNSAAFGGA